MIQALNIQATTNSALYNKGVAYCVSTFESLNTERKIIEKKIANNLVVPNICILSLSSRAGVNNTFFLLAYARSKRAVNPVNKGLSEVSFVPFFVSLPKLEYREIKNEITTIFNQ